MENNWIKIQTFERLHQAELRKDILEKNNINAIIVNEKDSLFLFGGIELYVQKQNANKAKAFIDEFAGLTKINSFIEKAPVEIFKKILENAGIQTILRVSENDNYIKDNYELYIENDKLEQVIPYLTGEKLTDKKIVKTTGKTRQASYFIEILEQNSIESLIIKKKDSDFHLQEIKIYVNDHDFEKAETILKELSGKTSIKKSEKLLDIEFYEEQLAYSGIKAIIAKTDNNYELKVDADKEEKAIDILNLKSEWVVYKVFPSIAEAMYYKDLLETAEIPTVILNEKDSSFLLGEIELYIEKANVEKAIKFIETDEGLKKSKI